MISRHGPDHVGAGKHQLVLSHASTQVTPTKEEITWNGGGEPAWPGPSMTNQRRIQPASASSTPTSTMPKPPP